MAVTTGRFCWRPKRISIAQFASAAQEHLRPRRVPSTNRVTRRAAKNARNTLFKWRAISLLIYHRCEIMLFNSFSSVSTQQNANSPARPTPVRRSSSESPVQSHTR